MKHFDYDLIPDKDERSIDDYMNCIFPKGSGSEIPDHVSSADVTDLCEIIGFTGTQNWDDQDMFNVLETLNQHMQLILMKWDHNKDGYGLPGIISNILGLSYNYVNTLFCIANEHGLIEYGTNLQIGWTTEKAKKVIRRRESNLKRIQEYVLSET